MAVTGWVRRFVGGLRNMLFPNLCEVCGTRLVEGEKHICLECLYNLPWWDTLEFGDNEIHTKLLHHVLLERAASVFYYSKRSRYAQLIQSAKYRNRPVIAQWLAELGAKKLSKRGFFDGIDAVVAVPMHWQKKGQRGYNQSDYVARGISNVTGIKVIDCLTTTRAHSSQTRKGVYERWANSEGLYSVADGFDCSGLHILVVDDVITTGSTLAACCEAILKSASDVKVSVMSLCETSVI